ncbi:hypothetical protein PIB30_096865 [Stylosanthes scabra]|uniref:Uncharacterized protein n=1 Tax=Stylosanthes scabra TaxID=79078 RepID=A0ABU6SWL5_9FABA|nr:hypothetical protein [Stylosanthes scabra]
MIADGAFFKLYSTTAAGCVFAVIHPSAPPLLLHFAAAPTHIHHAIVPLPAPIITGRILLPCLASSSLSRMTRNGKTPTKGSASTAAGSTAGNLSQLLLHSCFRTVSKKNSSYRYSIPRIERLDLSPLSLSLCTEDCAFL